MVASRPFALILLAGAARAGYRLGASCEAARASPHCPPHGRRLSARSRAARRRLPPSGSTTRRGRDARAAPRARRRRRGRPCARAARARGERAERRRRGRRRARARYAVEAALAHGRAVGARDARVGRLCARRLAARRRARAVRARRRQRPLLRLALDPFGLPALGAARPPPRRRRRAAAARAAGRGRAAARAVRGRRGGRAVARAARRAPVAAAAARSRPRRARACAPRSRASGCSSSATARPRSCSRACPARARRGSMPRRPRRRGRPLGRGMKLRPAHPPPLPPALAKGAARRRRRRGPAVAVRVVGAVARARALRRAAVQRVETRARAPRAGGGRASSTRSRAPARRAALALLARRARPVREQRGLRALDADGAAADGERPERRERLRRLARERPTRGRRGRARRPGAAGRRRLRLGAPRPRERPVLARGYARRLRARGACCATTPPPRDDAGGAAAARPAPPPAPPQHFIWKTAPPVLNSAACEFGVGVAAGNPGVKLLNAAGEAVAAEVTAAAAAADRGGAAVDVLDQWALSYARQTVGSSHHCKSTAPCRAAVTGCSRCLSAGRATRPPPRPKRRGRARSRRSTRWTSPRCSATARRERTRPGPRACLDGTRTRVAIRWQNRLKRRESDTDECETVLRRGSLMSSRAPAPRRLRQGPRPAYRKCSCPRTPQALVSCSRTRPRDRVWRACKPKALSPAGSGRVTSC